MRYMSLDLLTNTLFLSLSLTLERDTYIYIGGSTDNMYCRESNNTVGDRIVTSKVAVGRGVKEGKYRARNNTHATGTVPTALVLRRNFWFEIDCETIRRNREWLPCG